MSNVQRAIASLQKAVQVLDRAQNVRTGESDLDESATTPLNWSYAIGAAEYEIFVALEALGDSSLLDALRAKWRAQFKDPRSTLPKARS